MKEKTPNKTTNQGGVIKYSQKNLEPAKFASGLNANYEPQNQK